jgi:hypothetical protein
MKRIRELIVRFAKENSTWGYCRIQGALRNVGHRVAPSTIGKVLKEHGIKPAPDRPSSWRTVLKAHWGEIAATDFFTIEVWTVTGLRTIYVLFFIELKTRRVHVAGLTANPTDLFMGNATDGSLGFLTGCRFLIHDRDTKYSTAVQDRARGVGHQLDPYALPGSERERLRGTVRSLDQGRVPEPDDLLRRGHLRHAIDEYLAHYHGERNHQGLGNELIDGAAIREPCGEIVHRERLGGLLSYYERAA